MTCRDRKTSVSVFLCRPKPQSLQRHLSECVLCYLCGATLQVPKLSRGSATVGKHRALAEQRPVSDLLWCWFTQQLSQRAHNRWSPSARVRQAGSCVSAGLHTALEGIGDQQQLSSGDGERSEGNGCVRQNMHLYKTEIQNQESCILSIFIGWCSVLLYRAQKRVADGQMGMSCQATSGCPIEWHRAGCVFTSQGSRTMLVETAQLIPPKCPLNMIPKPKPSCRRCKKCLFPCYISLTLTETLGCSWNNSSPDEKAELLWEVSPLLTFEIWLWFEVYPIHNCMKLPTNGIFTNWKFEENGTSETKSWDAWKWNVLLGSWGCLVLWQAYISECWCRFIFTVHNSSFFSSVQAQLFFM